MAWSNGAAVSSPEPLELLAPSRYVADRRISVWFSVPSLAALLLNKRFLKPGSLPGLRLSLFCGEALPRKVAEAWQAAAPNSIVENLYGPTELTICCAAYRWNAAQSSSECVNNIVPIGQIYSGLDHVIVDDELRLVSPGDVGELCVAGSQTFPGYWRDPARTCARFFNHTDHRRAGPVLLSHGRSRQMPGRGRPRLHGSSRSSDQSPRLSNRSWRYRGCPHAATGCRPGGSPRVAGRERKCARNCRFCGWQPSRSDFAL